MIKLKDIVNQIKEGGKLFGARAERVSTQEMSTIFSEISQKLTDKFRKIQLSKSLKSKSDHGDIDIVVLNGDNNVEDVLKNAFGSRIIEYSKNGNIYSILYKCENVNKTVHVDFITSSSEEDYDPQYEYLSYNDFSGILGVMARRLHFNYGTHGFFKIYEDKRGQNHYILITKNLRDGLKILGFPNIEKYDKIESLDDIVDFISSSPLFSSGYYTGETMNNSDRKRVRSGRPSADYIRNKLISKNIKNSIDDEDYFFKKFFPKLYNNVQLEIRKIESVTVVTKIYDGNWILKNFPNVKPGKIINDIKLHWKSKFGDNIDKQTEETMLKSTDDYLNNIGYN
jgi:hypothetical protein